MNGGHFGQFSKLSYFSNISGLFWANSSIQQLYCACRVVFRMFLAILMFDPNSPFCKGYSLYMVAIFATFQNRLFFE